MASRSPLIAFLRPKGLGKALVAGCALFAVGCGASGDGNSPDMGKVAPKPNPNMSSQLPPEIRDQMSHANQGADAGAMSKMKPHGSKP